ncbi:MAG: HzsA-related protein [Pirellulaceae bacterium]
MVCVTCGAARAENPLPPDAVWLTPVAIVVAAGAAYGTTGRPEARHDSPYGAQSTIDGDPATFCCLLDDTLAAVDADPQTIPPGGTRPVTGRIVFDLGRAMTVVAVELIARDSAGVYAPKEVDLRCFAGDELGLQVALADGDKTTAANPRLLVMAHAVPPLTNGAAETITVPPVCTRYVELCVNDSYEAGPLHYNFQLAEFRVAVELTSADRQWLAAQMRREKIDDLLTQIDNLRQGVGYLRSAHPENYPDATLWTEIDQVQRITEAAAKAPWREQPGPSLATAREMLERLKRRALVEQNPLLGPGKILFVKRHTYRTDWYYAEFMQSGPPGGNLCVLDLSTGTVAELCPQLAGGIFDRFDLSFDGCRVLFGYRPAQDQALRIYEVHIDGTGLRQVTCDPPDEAARLASYGLDPTRNELGPWRGHTDDFHPCYLPDGGIVFTSSRCERGVLCDAEDNLSVNVLYRIDADGNNLKRLSENALSESTPSVMNDGRILYTRWEYVYKGVIAVQSLWAMHADGSGSTEVFGNQHVYPPVLIHGRAVPGFNNLFVATCTMHHPFAVGPILLIDTSRDIRTHAPLTNVTPGTDVTYEGSGTFPQGEAFLHMRNGRWVRDNTGPFFCDPWPLSDKFILVSSNPDKTHDDPTAYGLWLIDTFGNRVEIYSDPSISCWQPVPLRPRPLPPVIPSVESASTDFRPHESQTVVPGDGEATVIMADVYRGLDGVRRGDVKYLRILEQVPRPWTAKRFWSDDITYGQNAAISRGSHIFVTILHGIVPVEADGSAHFILPAGRSMFFQAIDEHYQEIERMRTFVNLRPGEVRSCIGCHQSRGEAPGAGTPLAMQRGPDRPRPQSGDETVPRPLYYPTDVQPLLDKHCIRCHSPEKLDGDLDLTGELTTFFSRSYEEIMGRKLIAYVQEFIGSDPEAQKGNVTPLGPKALGSHASPLIATLRAGHYDVRLCEAEWVRLITWVDANGPFYGSYFGRRNVMYRDLPDFRPIPTLDSARGLPPK